LQDSVVLQSAIQSLALRDPREYHPQFADFPSTKLLSAESARRHMLANLVEECEGSFR